VTIGEAGNLTTTLTYSQWNELVKLMNKGDLPALPLS
jgi:hypothetical protein